MQTFLPYPDYELSAKVLDRQRLGKQRVECIQILNALHQVNDQTGWHNHPATRMWRGHEPQLCEYGLVITAEWVARGYKDNVCKTQLENHLEWATAGDFTLAKPDWFGEPEFHLAHQSNLLRKDPTWYKQYFGDVDPNLPYIWPVD